MAPDLSIVIPTYNSARYIIRTINCICESLDGHDTAFELVVVNDGSHDDTQAVLVACQAAMKMVSLRIIRIPENKGQKIATQLGINVSRGAYILIYDDDMQYDFKYAMMLYEKIRQAPSRTGVLSGYYEPAGEEHITIKSVIRFFFDYVFFPGYRKAKFYTSLKIFRSSFLKDKRIVNIYHFWDIDPGYMDAIQVEKRERIFGQSSYDFYKLVLFILPVFVKCLSRVMYILSGLLLVLFLAGRVRIFWAGALLFLLSGAIIYLRINKFAVNKVRFEEYPI